MTGYKYIKIDQKHLRVERNMEKKLLYFSLILTAIATQSLLQFSNYYLCFEAFSFSLPDTSIYTRSLRHWKTWVKQIFYFALSLHFLPHCILGQCHAKTWHMRTAKAQISLRIRAV